MNKSIKFVLYLRWMTKLLAQLIVPQFENFGFTGIEPVSFHYYEQWLAQGFQADMSYLERHAPTKANPQLQLPSARSAIVVTKSYVPHPHPVKHSLPIAAYARGLDYHDWMLKDLKEVMAKLESQFPNEHFMPFVDSSPVLERDFAVRAGLGWIGKNACLIHQERGSFEFIGGILTSLPTSQFEEAQLAVAPDRCGTCTRCIDACPTGAIVAEKQIDANKCIAYLNIEAKSAPSPQLAKKIDSYFGCDICQDVCPWNRKVITSKPEADPEAIIEDLRYILTASNRQILSKFEGTPLTRATPNGHRRNAIVLAANMKLKILSHEIEKFSDHPILKDLTLWALQELARE